MGSREKCLRVHICQNNQINISLFCVNGSATITFLLKKKKKKRGEKLDIVLILLLVVVFVF